MLTPTQTRIHESALRLAREHRRIEIELLEALTRVESEGVFRALGYSSLFVYAVRALRLTGSVGYSFITVARKAQKVPALSEGKARPNQGKGRGLCSRRVRGKWKMLCSRRAQARIRTRLWAIEEPAGT